METIHMISQEHMDNVKSDSEKGHSHDHVDSKGNLLEKSHDCLLSLYLLRDYLESELRKEESEIKLIKK